MRRSRPVLFRSTPDPAQRATSRANPIGATVFLGGFLDVVGFFDSARPHERILSARSLGHGVLVHANRSSLSLSMQLSRTRSF